MSELKTLKEIETMDYAKDLGHYEISIDRFKEELKAEAIKHMSYLGKKNVVSEWIKYFFNLTEADLIERNGGKDD